jgi:hypothetical protein
MHDKLATRRVAPSRDGEIRVFRSRHRSARSSLSEAGADEPPFAPIRRRYREATGNDGGRSNSMLVHIAHSGPIALLTGYV